MELKNMLNDMSQKNTSSLYEITPNITPRKN
jgi:hypothetical protein